MILLQMLTEASIDTKLAEQILKSPLGRRYTDVTPVEYGQRQTGRGDSVYFYRCLCRSKLNKIETIEFLGTDAKLQTIAGLVLYSNNVPERTLYFNKPLPVAQVLQDLGAVNGMRHEEMTSFAILNFASLLTTIIGLIFVGKWLVQNYSATRDENAARRKAEQRLNEFLFKSQTGKEAAFDSYKTVISYVQNLINKQSRGIILYGMPGSGKTYVVRRTLHFANLRPDLDYTIVKGSSASVRDNIKIIYSTLYEYKNRIIVFDDFDSALSDINAINLLKAALDSYPVRIVSMPAMAEYNANSQPLPSRFEFTGRIIMITNKKEIDPALMSRTQSVAVNFTTKEFKDNIKETLAYVNPEIPLAMKKEVYTFLEDSMAKDPKVTIDYRRFSSMIDFRVAYPKEWQQLCTPILYPDRKR